MLFTPTDMIKGLADRMKSIRTRKGITRKQLAARSNVSYGSLRRFEETGKISLESFVKLAMELGLAAEINSLFTEPVYDSLEEVMNERRQKA
jgi:transcriptional regulator with XRE-family HTH domain